MVKIGDKIKISNTSVVVVKIFNDNKIKVIYIDPGNGYRVSDEAVFINESWQFETSEASGRKLKDSEYFDFLL